MCLDFCLFHAFGVDVVVVGVVGTKCSCLGPVVAALLSMHSVCCLYVALSFRFIFAFHFQLWIFRIYCVHKTYKFIRMSFAIRCFVRLVLALAVSSGVWCSCNAFCVQILNSPPSLEWAREGDTSIATLSIPPNTPEHTGVSPIIATIRILICAFHTKLLW